jgi:HSP20 family protein
VVEKRPPLEGIDPHVRELLDLRLEELLDLRLEGLFGLRSRHGLRAQSVLYPHVQGLLDPRVDLLAPSAPGAVIPMDAWRQGDALVLTFELPGADASAIELSVDEQVLTVSAKYATPPDQAGVEMLVEERFHGLHTRQVFLGYEADLDRIAATYTAGLLRVVIRVREASPDRQLIEVTTEPGAELSDMPSHPTIHLDGTDVPEDEAELSYGRQNAPALDSVARDLLSGTFPKAANTDIQRAATVLTKSVMHDLEVATVDFEEAQSTAHKLADILGHRTTN